MWLTKTVFTGAVRITIFVVSNAGYKPSNSVEKTSKYLDDFNYIQKKKKIKLFIVTLVHDLLNHAVILMFLYVSNFLVKYSNLASLN